MDSVGKCRKSKLNPDLAKSLSENEINQKLRKCEHYLGTFAMNELASLRISLFPSCLIVNFDDRTEEGSHWIALQLDLTNVYVCDSLGGLKPSKRLPQNLIDFLHIHTHNKTLHISKQLQSLTSDACGYYAATFILHINKNKSFTSFLSQFSDTNFYCNDMLVKLLFNKYD